MSRTERNVNMAAVVVPLVGVFTAMILAWRHALHADDLVILVVMYGVSAFGITVGFHRLLTHRAFETYAPVRYCFAVMGSLAIQGPVLAWVADHRKHHAFADQEHDPHSPHAHANKSVRAGLWHAHVGWLFQTQGQAAKRRYCSDLLKDATMRLIHRSFPLLALASLAIPFAAGLTWTGTLLGGAEALVWGGLVRIFLVHHLTWSVNSICHWAGRRRFDTPDYSTNVFWLALPTLGEAWHHNHHAFPRSAFHGLRWWEMDPSGWLIAALAKIGLAWDLVLVDHRRECERLARPRASA